MSSISHRRVLKSLEERYAAGTLNPNQLDETGLSLVHQAAYDGQLTCFKWLLQHGGDPLSRSSEGSVAAHYAAAGGHLQILIYLNDDSSQNIDMKDDNGTYPLYISAQEGQLDCLIWLAKHSGIIGSEPAKDGMTAVHAAAQEGHLDCVRYLIQFAHCSSVVTDKAGCTPLHFAAAGGHWKIVKWLLEHGGAMGDERDKTGSAAIHLAAEYGKLKVIKTLLKLGVPPMMRDGTGKTAMDIATQFKHSDCADYLNEHQKRSAIMQMTVPARSGKLKKVRFNEGDQDQNIRIEKGYMIIPGKKTGISYDTDFRLTDPWKKSIDLEFDFDIVESSTDSSRKRNFKRKGNQGNHMMQKNSFRDRNANYYISTKENTLAAIVENLHFTSNQSHLQSQRKEQSRTNHTEQSLRQTAFHNKGSNKQSQQQRPTAHRQQSSAEVTHNALRPRSAPKPSVKLQLELPNKSTPHAGLNEHPSREANSNSLTSMHQAQSSQIPNIQQTLLSASYPNLSVQPRLNQDRRKSGSISPDLLKNLPPYSSGRHTIHGFNRDIDRFISPVNQRDPRYFDSSEDGSSSDSSVSHHPRDVTRRPEPPTRTNSITNTMVTSKEEPRRASTSISTNNYPPSLQNLFGPEAIDYRRKVQQKGREPHPQEKVKVPRGHFTSLKERAAISIATPRDKMPDRVTAPSGKQGKGRLESRQKQKPPNKTSKRKSNNVSHKASGTLTLPWKSKKASKDNDNRYSKYYPNDSTVEVNEHYLIRSLPLPTIHEPYSGHSAQEKVSYFSYNLTNPKKRKGHMKWIAFRESISSFFSSLRAKRREKAYEDSIAEADGSYAQRRENKPFSISATLPSRSNKKSVTFDTISKTTATNEQYNLRSSMNGGASLDSGKKLTSLQPGYSEPDISKFTAMALDGTLRGVPKPSPKPTLKSTTQAKEELLESLVATKDGTGFELESLQVNAKQDRVETGNALLW